MQVAITDALMNNSIFLPARSIITIEEQAAITCTTPTITDDVMGLGDETPVAPKILLA